MRQTSDTRIELQAALGFSCLDWLMVARRGYLMLSPSPSLPIARCGLRIADCQGWIGDCQARTVGCLRSAANGAVTSRAQGGLRRNREHANAQLTIPNSSIRAWQSAIRNRQK